MTEPGDTTPISDEADVLDPKGRARALRLTPRVDPAGLARFADIYDKSGTFEVAWVARALAAALAAPLLVSAEAERRGDSDELLAAAAHESSEDRRLAALMVEPRNRAVLERRAEVTERLAAEVEGLRAELAEAKALLEQGEQHHRDEAEWLANGLCMDSGMPLVREGDRLMCGVCDCFGHRLRAAGGPSDADVMKWVAEHPYFGDWDTWAPIAYDHIPVLPRMALSHLYGRHAERESPFAHCVFCELFDLRAAGGQERPELPVCGPFALYLHGECYSDGYETLDAVLVDALQLAADRDRDHDEQGGIEILAVAVGGQEKPNGALAFEDIACAACGAVGEFHHIPAAPVGGQAEPSDDLGEAAAHALLGQQVEVVIEREHEGEPPVIVSGQLLAFSNDGEILTRQEDGSVWSSWPRLEVRAAAAVSGEHRNQDGKTHQGPPENCRECAYEDGAYL